ncbi:MAG: hypothetical protein JXR76_26260 [Deltaproteobacteria bacterium]|nr:hypothetical protein [Deltaproteobacteria bacterium]
MQLLTNELSIHKQFHDISTFKMAIGRLMTLRAVAKEFGVEVYCNRNLVASHLNDTTSLQQGVASLDKNQQRAFMQWITFHGPFLDDIRSDDIDDEYLEYNDEPVTECAIGEAAWASYYGIAREVISLSPSNWEFSPIHVKWKKDDHDIMLPPVANYWDPETLKRTLSSKPSAIDSWETLEDIALARFTNLTFLQSAFSYLEGSPFSVSAAERIVILLDVLNKLKGCFDGGGRRTPEGHELYQKFFTGKKGGGGRGALFSDSSDGEKNDFRNQMTFAHPEEPQNPLFCPFHGKVQTPQMRIHFSYPITYIDPLYVAYVGPKITRR